jgi:hypothetical protein
MGFIFYKVCCSQQKKVLRWGTLEGWVLILDILVEERGCLQGVECVIMGEEGGCWSWIYFC